MLLKKIKDRYFGDKNFYKMVLAIALPIIFQSLLTNLVGLADNVMVGSLGTDQMNGVAVINQLFFVFNLAIFGGMSGVGIFSAQYFGRDDHKGVRNVFRAKIIIGIVLLIVGLLVFIFLHQPLINMFLHEGGSSGNIYKTFNYAKDYLFIMLIGLPPFVLANCYSTTLKEAGQTVVPMIAGFMAVGVDVVFNYLLIFGKFGFPELGVEGAAIATALSRFIECGYLVIYTHKKSHIYKFIKGAYASLKIPVGLARNMLLKGSPVLINEFLWSFGLTLQTQALSTRGLAAIGALNINNTVSNVFNTVFLTLGLSISIVVGQLLGASKLKEAKDTARKMTVFSVLTACMVSIVLVIVAPYFPLIYDTTDEIRYLATRFIWVLALVTPLNSFCNATYFTLRSGGKTIITFLFDSCYIWLVNVPLSMGLAYFTDLPVIYIFLIVNCVETIKCIIGYILIKKDVWLNTIVE